MPLEFDPKDNVNTDPPYSKDGQCDCCGYGPVAVWRFEPDRHAEVTDERYLCDVCSRTPVGNWVAYSRVHDPVQRELGQLIAWCTNHVLNEIRTGNNNP